MSHDGEAVQLAFVTDMGLFEPTLLSLWSALRHTSGPVTVHFAGFGLTTEARARIERCVGGSRGARLRWLSIDAANMQRAEGNKAHISASTMGRMFLPRHCEGRVIYVDGDTLVTDCLRPLAGMDMHGRALGAVPDYVVSKWAARGEGNPDRINEMRALMGDVPWSSYFNAGVLLLDCDAIRADLALMDSMEDIEKAASLRMADQDRLNQLFAGRSLSLDPAWNASWGRVNRQRRFLRNIGAEVHCVADRATVLHFHGPHKPWRRLRLSTLARGAGSVLRYRAAMRAAAATGL